MLSYTVHEVGKYDFRRGTHDGSINTETCPHPGKRASHLARRISAQPQDEDVLITPQEVLANSLLDEIGEALRATGLTLEELIESGREERGKFIEEKYGLKAT